MLGPFGVWSSVAASVCVLQSPMDPSLGRVVVAAVAQVALLLVLPGAAFAGGASFLLGLSSDRLLDRSRPSPRQFALAFGGAGALVCGLYALLPVVSGADGFSPTSTVFLTFPGGIGLLGVGATLLVGTDRVSVPSLLGAAAIASIPTVVVVARVAEWAALPLVPTLPVVAALPAGYALACGQRRVGLVTAGAGFALPWAGFVTPTVGGVLFFPLIAAVEFVTVPVLLVACWPFLTLGGALTADSPASQN